MNLDGILPSALKRSRLQFYELTETKPDLGSPQFPESGDANQCQGDRVCQKKKKGKKVTSNVKTTADRLARVLSLDLISGKLDIAFEIRQQRKLNCRCGREGPRVPD